MQQRKLFTSALMTFVIGLTGGLVGSQLGPWLRPAAVPDDNFIQPKPVRLVAPRSGAAGIDVADLVESVNSAVVNIDTEANDASDGQPTDPFRFFYDGESPSRPQPQKGVGSGFIVASEGLIITNYHVINGATKLNVTLLNGDKHVGKVVGTDPLTDLALVRIEAKRLPTLRLADPKGLRVGQGVLAVGSPLGLQQTVTTGIISAINRNIGLNARVAFLQTDAAINPGNSGGPLLNLQGEVIGVNTAIAAQGQGIGFAIPVDTLQAALPELRSTGTVTHAWLGVGVISLPEDRTQLSYPEEYGVLVQRVERNSPAAKAGVLPGDVLMTFNGKHLDASATLVSEVSKLPVGSKAEVRLSRKGQQRDISIRLGPMPKQLGQ